MMGAAERMRRVLRRTGLYSVDGDGILEAELAAYGTALEIFAEAYEKARENLFIQTADAEGLTKFERLFRVIPAEESAENRRAMLLMRGAVTAQDCTKASLERQLLGAGIRGSLTMQRDGSLYVNVGEVLGISQEAARQEALDLLPAHLIIVFDFGKNTWDAVESRSQTFNQMDAANLTWDEIDAR